MLNLFTNIPAADQPTVIFLGAIAAQDSLPHAIKLALDQDILENTAAINFHASDSLQHRSGVR